MTRVWLCTTSILISFLVSSVYCQEENDRFWETFWEKAKEMFKKSLNALRNAWGDFKQEMKARAEDITSWTQEAWNRFKESMYKWLDGRNDINESEKDDMRKVIERMKMPEKESER